MSVTHPFDPPRTPLEEVMTRTYQTMIERGYPYHTVYELSRSWRQLSRYAEEQDVDTLSPALAQAYLCQCQQEPDAAPGRLALAKRAVRILMEFHQERHWRQHPLRRQETALISPAFALARDRFLDYWKTERQVSENTYQYGWRYATQFLLSLEVRGLREWSQLSAPLVSEFVTANPNWRASSRSVAVSTLRAFFRYLFTSGQVERDWSHALPLVRRVQNQQLPAIWTSEEITALLAAVDRTSAIGKRDYAILLLACRLGMRPSDIRTLQLDQIHWAESRLVLTQEKTGAELILPLPTEVGEGLIEYLRAGRPVSPRREVFLSHIPPFGPLSRNNRLYGQLKRYRERAGIPCRPGQASGMHSLRHTFATRLQQAQVPLETISDLLGHQSLAATRVYTHVDIAALRQVALDPEEVMHGC